MFTIVPCRCRKNGSAALMPSQGPFKLIESVWSQRASLVDSTVPRGLMPAQLTSRSSPPHSALSERDCACPVALASYFQMLGQNVEAASC